MSTRCATWCATAAASRSSATARLIGPIVVVVLLVVPGVIVMWRRCLMMVIIVIWLPIGSIEGSVCVEIAITALIVPLIPATSAMSLLWSPSTLMMMLWRWFPVRWRLILVCRLHIVAVNHTAQRIVLFRDLGPILTLPLHFHVVSRPQHICPRQSLLLHAFHLVALTLDFATHKPLVLLGDADCHFLLEAFLALDCLAFYLFHLGT